MTRKLICFDIDNTLYDNRNQTVPTKTKEALYQLKNGGFDLCLATGREMEYIPNEVMDLCEWDGFICCNGQCIYDTNKEIVRLVLLDHKTLKECVSLADSTHSTLEMRGVNGNFVANEYTDVYRRVSTFLNRPLWPLKPLDDNDQVIMAMVTRDQEANYEDFKHIEGIHVSTTKHEFADINSESCTKSEGINYFMELFGYTSYFAVGDSMNDFDMLKNAKYAIAMGDADSHIIDICDYVTATVGNNGIYQTVKHILDDFYD